MSRGNGCCVSRKRPVRRKRPFRILAQSLRHTEAWGRSFRRRRRSTGQPWRRRNGWGPSTRGKTGRFWMSRQGFWQKDWRREEPARSAAPFTIPLLPESRKGRLRKPSFGNPRQPSAEAAKKKGGVQEKTAYLRERLAGLLKYDQAASEESSKAGKAFRPEGLPGARELFLGGAWEQELGRRYERLKERLSGLARQIREEEAGIRRKEELGREIPGAEEKSRRIQEELSGLRERLAAAASRRKELETQAQGLRGRLPFGSFKEAEQKAEQLEQQKKTLEEALEAAARECQAQEQEKARLEGQVSQLAEQLKSAEAADRPSLLRSQEELKAEKNGLTERQKTSHARISGNASALENMKLRLEKQEELEQRLSWVRALSNTASGNIAGKEKVMLETYIQTTYFDRIIRRANLRFLSMSGGQYELKRSREAGNNRSQSGLELNVIDHYNGTERSVRTLSGGESFQASLCLALGLSDEIQASAGGIRLDAMFVDEGFGSLDEEALRQAIETLAGLAGGNRLVGIISHVAELKERIDRQIIVTKEREGGSRVRIEM